MKIQMRLLFSFLFTLIIIASFGQKGQLTGIVVDNKSKNPMSYVTVSIHDFKDTNLLTGGITNSEGIFKINDVVLGKSYLFKCSFIGYQTIFQKVDFSNNKSIHLNNVVLSPSNEIDTSNIC